MFSVVIPLYNKAHTIERTLASVLSQTYKDFEVIIVNDGSTDNGVEVIHSFTKDSRIRIFDQKNQGVSVARNRGVAEAKFEYIALLDGDDAWLPEFLDTIRIAILKYPNAGIYGTSSIHIDSKSNIRLDSTIKKFKNKILIVDVLKNYEYIPHTSAIVISKSSFKSIDVNGEGFPVGMKVCEDWTCFLRIAFRFPTVYIGFPLALRYNNVEGQVTGTSSEQRTYFLPHIVRYYNITFSDWKNTGMKNSFLKSLKYELRIRILSYLKKNDYDRINYLLSNIDSSLVRCLHPYEPLIYKSKRMKLLSKLVIYSFKINKLTFI